MRIPARLADRAEQIIAALFYAWLVWRLLSGGRPDVKAVAVLAAEATILLFLLLRRPTDLLSLKLGDWLVAVVGTCAALLVRPSAPAIDASIGLVLMLLGTGVAIASKLALRRSFGLVAANRGIKVGGLYGLVRHPMYAGYIVSHLGILLMWPSLWNVGVYAASWTALALRVRAEERLLIRDETYAAYARRVRFRLIPGIY